MSDITPTFHGEMGIYAIVNLRNGKRYVGSSINIPKRWRRHGIDLRGGIHHSVALQRAWRKYGEDSFAFVLLACIEEADNLLAAEQHFIDRYRCHSPAYGYNVSPTAGNALGVKHTEATRQKLREGLQTRGHPMLGKSHSEESRLRMSKSRRGVPRGPRSEEVKRKLSLSAQGRIISDEQRDKISNTLRGRKRDPLAAARSAAGHVGQKRTEEQKKRMSDGIKQAKLLEYFQRQHWVYQL
jgi:group I intron endonuclease